MTAISQKYNTYLQGMSDQPDEIMKPGQLKDSVNTFPDVTFGLLKRPSLGFTKYVDTRMMLDGCWGSYYRVTNHWPTRRIHPPGTEEWSYSSI